MPRGPRLDAPGALQHVMVRGIEGRPIFDNDRDRQDWVERLAAVRSMTGFALLAWALLPNHVHLLARTGRQPLATAMRCLLTGYAVNFNRRHRRVGHLFQNRYKSILVEEESYLLELVRYIHLNPLRAGVVKRVVELEAYPWSGHSALVGQIPRPWQAVDEVLAQFGPRKRQARQRYREYVAAGAPQGRRPELQGGGLRRSAGGWEAVAQLRRGREYGMADERILGSGAFVEEVHRIVTAQDQPPPRALALAALPELLKRCAAAWGLTVDELGVGSRRRVVAQARAVAGGLAVRRLGLPITNVARALGVSSVAIHQALGRCEGILRSRGLSPADLLPAPGRYLK